MSDTETIDPGTTATLTMVKPARRSPLRRALIIGMVALLWLLPLLGAGVWIVLQGKPRAVVRRGPAYTTEWSNDTRTTPRGFDAFAHATPSYAVDSRFAAYYQSHAGANLLGQPLTQAYPTAVGVVQFFAAGALLLPTSPAVYTAGGGGFGDVSDQMFRDGQYDAASGVLRLPLLHALLTSGSLTPLAGDDATLTYADLRAAVLPIALSKATATAAPTVAVDQQEPSPEPSFAYVDAQAQHHSGPIIPEPMWAYLNRSDVAPDGWLSDFGLPLTLALPVTVTLYGTQRHMVVQAFGRGALLEDLNTSDIEGEPVVVPLETGLGYLETLGPPAAAPPAGGHAWATGNLTVAAAPAAGAKAHVGANFQFTLRGDAEWAGADLWYHVSWAAGHSGEDGWVDAASITQVAPPPGSVAFAAFDVLSPSLAGYLNGWGGGLGVVVYDVTRGQYYTYNPNGEFAAASSFKVPIMLATLQMTESQGREPNSYEMSLLTAMIENSDNDSAQALFVEIGGMGPIQGMLGSLGIGGLQPNYGAWGYSLISPMAMVKLLTALHDGRILTASDRALALNLMENIESDQQMGVGDTAPHGATYAMKDGWVVGTDGYWGMNSSGIMTVGSETYIISVYSRQGNYDWSFAEHVCGQVAKLLT
jgi:beta-lactamase class A